MLKLSEEASKKRSGLKSPNSLVQGPFLEEDDKVTASLLNWLLRNSTPTGHVQTHL